MTSEHVTMGIKGVPDKYFNHDFSYKIVEDESFWTLGGRTRLGLTHQVAASG